MLIDTLKKDLQKAQVNKNEVEVSTLRLLLSELKYAEIQIGKDLSDNDVILAIQKEVKKRKEAAEGFRKGNREELAQKEEAEAGILQKYLPEQLSDEELIKIVEEVIVELGAKSVQDMGKVIGQVMGKVTGRVEGGRVSALVKEKLVC